MKEIFNTIVAATFSIVMANTETTYDEARPLPRLAVNNEPVTTASVLRAGEEIFLPLRAVAERLGAEVNWTTYEITIIYNGEKYFPNAFLRDSTAFVSLNELRTIFAKEVNYYPSLNLLRVNNLNKINYEFAEEPTPIAISTVSSPQISIENFATLNGYTEEDLYWLSRIIYAEARGESFKGMLAVGSVVMNRKTYHAYPNTVKEVIFDTRNGVQFSPVLDGSINNIPHSMATLAAIEVLEGRRNAGYTLFFKNPNIVPVSWISNNRQYAFSIANHSFFY
ncbi:MAG: cell wall hydrolase [Defluviitaleaceae bacterium]|nr:cell wall hydrolase [Defluviitaleaceae bacterium]